MIIGLLRCLGFWVFLVVSVAAFMVSSASQVLRFGDFGLRAGVKACGLEPGPYSTCTAM